jgi:hypothetical protein
MTDSRSAAVLFGAVVVVLALFAPWYAIDLSGAARGALAQQTGQLPPVLAELARGVLAVLPDRVVADGWEAFERTDIVLLCCALAAAFAALLRRLDVAALAGAGAGLTTLVAMVHRPGPGNEIVQVHLQWGAWVALAGAALIVAAALRSAPPPVRVESFPQPDWTVPPPSPVEAPASVAPPAS